MATLASPRPTAAGAVAYLAALGAVAAVCTGLTGWSALPAAPFVAGPVGAERARVSRVIDGDTVVLEDGRSVRLLGIDAPETVNPRLAGAQPLGAAASRRLAEMVEGRRVTLERDHSETDHYGRLLRHVWVGRTLVSEVLVADGLAWAGAVPPDTRHRERLRSAEDRARGARLGLWGLSRPTPLPVFAVPGP